MRMGSEDDVEQKCLVFVERPKVDFGFVLKARPSLAELIVSELRTDHIALHLWYCRCGETSASHSQCRLLVLAIGRY